MDKTEVTLKSFRNIFPPKTITLGELPTGTIFKIDNALVIKTGLITYSIYDYTHYLFLMTGETSASRSDTRIPESNVFKSIEINGVTHG